MESGRKAFGGRRILIIAAVAIVAFAIFTAYLELTINSLLHSITPMPSNVPKSSVNGSITYQDVLLYDNARQYVPYILLSYRSSNSSELTVNASLYRYPPPQRIYIVNTSNECFQCGNMSLVMRALYSALEGYGLISNASQVTIVSPNRISSVQNDSILIVLNGLLPSSFLAQSGNSTALDALLNGHVSILYAGQGFNNMLLPDSVVVPETQVSSRFPDYLLTTPFSGNVHATGTGFYFNRSSFQFNNGTQYADYLTYESAGNGSIAAFSNTITSWRNGTQAGIDIAKAVQSMFWLGRYAYGARTVRFNNSNQSGSIGIFLNETYFQSNRTVLSQLRGANLIRVVMSSNEPYGGYSSKSGYRYISQESLLNSNGTISISNSLIVNQSFPVSFNISTGSSARENIQPHISIYNVNFSQVYTFPLPFINNVSGNFTFTLPKEYVPLPPGRQYIMRLYSFSSTEYSGALFSVYPVNLTLVSANATSGRFIFYASSGRQPIQNINYSISLNGLYKSSGTITNGTIIYVYPAALPHGALNFSVSVMGGSSYYRTSYNPIPFTVNPQYIEVLVVIVVMLVMVIFVRAPARDEYYVDVPNLPTEKHISIRLKPKDVVSSFNKLNDSYRWRYMPLSKSEARTAIMGSVRINNIPVALTYNNVENILDQLASKGIMEAADNLYAPSDWMAQSGHDIEYLAAFKKMRMYLVTHAYMFTDMDASDSCDILATIHGEKKYLVIYSKTSRFQKIPIFTGSKTYLVFLNSYRLDQFMNDMRASGSESAEELKMYMDSGYVKLVDAENPDPGMNS